MPDFKSDFLSAAPSLEAFFPRGTAQPDWARAIKARAGFSADIRAQVVADLRAQYSTLPASAEVAASLDALALPDTLVVTTGQQPGLFGGPLYTLHKTVSVIALAQWLSRTYGVRVVPVFWMASEDHDWAEVNQAAFSYMHTVSYPAPWQGAVGRFVLGDAITDLTQGNALLAESYTPGRTWAEAFRALWHRLFAEHGLIVLDADRPALKRIMAPLFARELTERASEALVTERTARLTALGYPAQILPRPINLFYLTGTGRHRITLSGGTFGAEGYHQQWTQAEILAELNAHPERFSPNVVLRPVYQECILPNVAYLGGWAEVAYWAQLGEVFEYFGVPFPVVYPRMQALIAPQAEWADWLALGLTQADLTTAPHLLRRRIASTYVHPEAEALRATASRVASELAQLAERFDTLDGGQARNVRGQAARSEAFFARLEQKLLDRLARRHPEWAEPTLRLQEKIQPYGAVQERVLTWAALTPDPSALIRALLDRAQDPKHFGRIGEILTLL